MSEAEQLPQQEPREHQDQRVYTREFKLEAVRLSESSYAWRQFAGLTPDSFQ